MGCCSSSEAASDEKSAPGAPTSSSSAASDKKTRKNKIGSKGKGAADSVEAAAVKTSGRAKEKAKNASTSTETLDRAASRLEESLGINLPRPDEPLKAHRQPSEGRDVTKAAVDRDTSETPTKHATPAAAVQAVEGAMQESNKAARDLDGTLNIQKTTEIGLEAESSTHEELATATTAAVLAVGATSGVKGLSNAPSKSAGTAPAAVEPSGSLASLPSRLDATSAAAAKAAAAGTAQGFVNAPSAVTEKIDLEDPQLKVTPYAPVARQGLLTPTKQSKTDVPPLRLPHSDEASSSATGQVVAAGLVIASSLAAFALMANNGQGGTSKQV